MNAQQAALQARESVAAYRPPNRGKATYQDILDAPSNLVAELIHGTLYTHPRPGPDHGESAFNLGGELFNPFKRGRDGPGGWRILAEPEIHFSKNTPDENILVPDLAGWRLERMPQRPKTAYYTLTPDWVCEVLSPSTRRIDLTAKRDIYAREGVPHLWLVDPIARTLEAFELRAGQWSLIAAVSGDAAVSLPPFDAISFPLGALWD